MESQKQSHHHSGHNHQQLIDTLLECVKSCEECAAASLEEDDVTSMAHCIELDRDCSDVCTLAAKLLMRDSEIADKFLSICEEICNLCAEECSSHDHEHCKRCAESCRKCAEACHAHHKK